MMTWIVHFYFPLNVHFYFTIYNWELTKLIEFNRYCDVVEQIDIIGRLEKQMENNYEFNSINLKNMNCILDTVLVKIRTDINNIFV